jgi:hypothetical protein
MMTDRGKPKYSVKNVSQYHPVHNKTYLDCFGMELGLPR